VSQELPRSRPGFEYKKHRDTSFTHRSWHVARRTLDGVGGLLSAHRSHAEARHARISDAGMQERSARRRLLFLEKGHDERSWKDALMKVQNESF